MITFRSLVEADLNKTWALMGPKLLKNLSKSDRVYLSRLIGNPNPPSDEDIKTVVFRTSSLLDPTPNHTYARWLMQQMIDGTLDIWGREKSDHSSVRNQSSLLSTLQTYEKLRQRNLLPKGTDILQLTPKEVWDVVSTEPGKSPKEQAEEGSKVIFKNSKWEVREINTYAASRYYSSRTNWCTGADSAKGKEACESYLNDGKLVMFLSPHEKYLMWFTNPIKIVEFRDAADTLISIHSFVETRTENAEAMKAVSDHYDWPLYVLG